MHTLHCTSACREHKDSVARQSLIIFALSLALLAGDAFAEVSESLSYTDYRVEANGRQSLSKLLANSSPIRHKGKTFHAYTTWRISWQYRWDKDTDGACRIARVSTTLDTTIQLPRLDNASARQQEQFQRYLVALRQHELGHHHYGRQAAQEVDRQLQAMPAMPDCTRLIAAANRLAHHIVERYKDEERTYDLVTVHGRTQGARLDY
ncbi:conserved hypothetical protein [Pseudomonas sp. OF001]|jgi:predicted secreted Zn-dependent protease|uniref:DUF922 domain-containing protein n=1 Tax=unclassified Pseudomonas TaxID=196821 RepID=UPI0019180DDA|nr:MULTISPECIES: DUF922 domain-containing protein [unclassified Pseudomonas]WPP46048.1 DUF922 domain-containing protein [Pseudomonas sp. AN-1]CAD5378566.1 conserved hypothetical protein [Pseudomonas sp. OF001]